MQQLKTLLAQLAANPAEVDKLAMRLARSGAMPPDINQIDQMKRALQQRKQMTQQVQMQQMAQPVMQQQMPAPGGSAPVVTPVSPQQPQAVNQQLGIVKGQNPYLMR